LCIIFPEIITWLPAQMMGKWKESCLLDLVKILMLWHRRSCL
jgi:hypothetical protein